MTLVKLDGVRLGLAIANNLPSPVRALAAFEAEMFARTGRVAQESAETAAMLQSPTAAQDMARFFGTA